MKVLVVVVLGCDFGGRAGIVAVYDFSPVDPSKSHHGLHGTWKYAYDSNFETSILSRRVDCFYAYKHVTL